MGETKTKILLFPSQGPPTDWGYGFEDADSKNPRGLLSPLETEHLIRQNAWSFGSTLYLLSELTNKSLSTGTNGHLSQLITETESRLVGLLSFLGENPALASRLAFAEDIWELLDEQIELVKIVNDGLIGSGHEVSSDIVALSLSAHSLEALGKSGFPRQVVAAFRHVVRSRGSELAIPVIEINAF